MVDHIPDATESGMLHLEIDGEDTYRSWDVEDSLTSVVGTVVEMVTLAPSFTSEPESLVVFRIKRPTGGYMHAQITQSLFLEVARIIRMHAVASQS